MDIPLRIDANQGWSADSAIEILHAVQPYNIQLCEEPIARWAFMRLVKPKKFLGQHFLKDLKVAQDIADTVDIYPELPILEVGPGMGVLTQFLTKKERCVKVVEVDYESVAYLRENYPALEDHIIEDDFLKMNLQRVFNGQPFVLTGNYPYNISSQIFFKMLDNKDLVPCCTGMKNELQIYENNLGFLTTSSKKGSTLLTEVNRKVEKLKADLELVQQKIKVIDENIQEAQ